MISNTFPSIREPPHETNKSKLGVTSYTQDENENISHMLSKTQRSRLSLVLQEEQESLLHWTQIREKLTIEIQNSNKEATTAEIAEAVVSTQSTGEAQLSVQPIICCVQLRIVHSCSPLYLR
eukprot:TRINITY_DN6749_c0_g1_i8.p2 TRINITY_DN6749_c0_g1~~TRINITY_DN6749_c0_g1_i8.p2  ORF type:complete len:122 (+),score=27.65 TRINITY_DN6749_c0_g1_i8:177-542(+)